MEKITPEIFQGFKQILFFLQKGGDLDACASTWTLMKLVEAKFPDTSIKLIYIDNLTKKFKGFEQYRARTISDIDRKEKKTLGVFCDISSIKEITNKAFLNFCRSFYVFNHHEDHGD